MNVPCTLNKTLTLRTVILALARAVHQTTRESLLFATVVSMFLVYTLVSGQAQLADLQPLEGYLKTRAWTDIHMPAALMLYCVGRAGLLAGLSMFHQTPTGDFILVIPLIAALLISQGWLFGFLVSFGVGMWVMEVLSSQLVRKDHPKLAL